jgi:hypothetical protein
MCFGFVDTLRDPQAEHRMRRPTSGTGVELGNGIVAESMSRSRQIVDREDLWREIGASKKSEPRIEDLTLVGSLDRRHVSLCDVGGGEAR